MELSSFTDTSHQYRSLNPKPADTSTFSPVAPHATARNRLHASTAELTLRPLALPSNDRRLLAVLPGRGRSVVVLAAWWQSRQGESRSVSDSSGQAAGFIWQHTLSFVTPG